ARLLIQLGHRRIALINGNPDQTFAIHRERGARRALAAAGIALPDSFARATAMTEENGYRSMRDFLTLPERPTAVIRSSLLMTLGAIRALRDAGLSAPDDVSIISHDDVFPFLKPESFPVPLSTTRSSIRAAGARIAERLAARIAGIEQGAHGEVWPVDLVVRG